MNVEDFIREKAACLGDSDISKALKRAEEILNKLKGPLAKFTRKIELFLNMLRDYHSGIYRKTPRWTIMSLVFVLLYVLMPFDCVPDMIPGAGLLDDAVLVMTAWTMLKKDIAKYEKWRKNEGYQI